MLASEDSNDCRIVAEIVKQHHPDLSNARLVEISDKTRLKTATGPELAARIRTVIGKAKGRALRAKGPLVGLVIHEDLDGYESRAQGRRAGPLGLLASGPTGTNRSYKDFVHELGQWSAASVPSPRRR